MVKLKEHKVSGNVSGSGKRVLIIDGQKYVADHDTYIKKDGIDHVDKIIFKKFNEKKFEEDLKTVVDCLKDRTTTEELLNQILKDIDMKQLRKLAKRIREKKPIKKHDGCLGFKIGDSYIEVVD